MSSIGKMTQAILQMLMIKEDGKFADSRILHNVAEMPHIVWIAFFWMRTI